MSWLLPSTASSRSMKARTASPTLSLTDVSHYFDSDPTKLIAGLRDDGKAPTASATAHVPVIAQQKRQHHTLAIHTTTPPFPVLVCAPRTIPPFPL